MFRTDNCPGQIKFSDVESIKVKKTVLKNAPKARINFFHRLFRFDVSGWRIVMTKDLENTMEIALE